MKTFNVLVMGFSVVAMYSCGTSFLELKPDQSQRVPATIEDYRGLMDQIGLMNAKSSHVLGMIGGDEYFITDARYHSFPLTSNRAWQKNAYTWESQIYEGEEGNTTNNPLDWNMGYQRILQANIAIDGLSQIKESAVDRRLWEIAMGEALFHRAYNYYSIAQLFCDPYNPSTAAESLGLPMRLEPDVTTKMGRSNLSTTYAQIIEDLTAAEQFLPELPDVVFRPANAAVYALLARIYLQMGDYKEAGLYADKGLALQDGLLDYNDLVLGETTRSFPAYGEQHPEVIFMNSVYVPTIMRDTYFNADSNLLKLYEPGDLRKVALFIAEDDAVLFRGSYEGTANFFTGFATDEMYLVSAECAARTGELTKALARLNELRKHRFTHESFVSLTSADGEEVLHWIVAERRKELVLRGTRWEDLRRLNVETQFATTLKREIDGEMKVLLPGDIRFTWPIPLEAIQQGGYTQNER